jgi:hypothetical protein
MELLYFDYNHLYLQFTYQSCDLRQRSESKFAFSSPNVGLDEHPWEQSEKRADRDGVSLGTC